jgi:hypothetical protein
VYFGFSGAGVGFAGGGGVVGLLVEEDDDGGAVYFGLSLLWASAS